MKPTPNAFILALGATPGECVAGVNPVPAAHSRELAQMQRASTLIERNFGGTADQTLSPLFR
jgi:hypothetical protein